MNQIGRGFDFDAGALSEYFAFDVVVITAVVPVADVIFVEVFASIAEVLDDFFVGEAVVQQLVDLLARAPRVRFSRPLKMAGSRSAAELMAGS